MHAVLWPWLACSQGRDPGRAPLPSCRSHRALGVGCRRLPPPDWSANIVAVKRGWLHSAGRSALLDVLPAVLAAATLLLVSRQATADQVPPRRPLDATADAIFVLAGLGLVCRRRAPAALLALEVLLGSVHLAFGYPTGPMFILVIVAAYTFACSTGTRLTVAATGPAALALVVAGLIGNYRIGCPAQAPSPRPAGCSFRP